MPETLDNLAPMNFIGEAAVEIIRAKIKMMAQLQLTEEQRKATLRDGQDAGEMLLDIEARIGELAMKEPGSRHKRRSYKGKSSPVHSEVHRKINVWASMADAYTPKPFIDNPDIVARVIAQARENEDIPTKTAVLNEIDNQRSIDRAVEKKKLTTKESGNKNLGNLFQARF